MKKKVAVVTGSRADYGLLCWVMKEIKKRKELELIPIATGAHLEEQWGKTVDLIKNDGFDGLVEIKVPITDTSPHGICGRFSSTVERFSEYFRDSRPDMLLLLGDRYEILAVAMAALIHNIPIIHAGGGEISEGVIDDSIRHALTKLSQLHLVIAGKCAERIKKMGEEPWRVHVVGSPRLDYAHQQEYRSKKELSEKFGIRFEKTLGLVIFHPVTLDYMNVETQVKQLLQAMDRVDMEYAMLYPNIDTGSGIISREIEEYASSRDNVYLLRALELTDYLSILKHCDMMIGNSSAGIIESPLFKLPVVNIGNRQKGRDCMKNVIHTSNAADDIVAVINKAMSAEFRNSLKDLKNSYGDGYASIKIADIICDMPLEKLRTPKKNCF
ncbi:MAG: UDP-N-acetyl-D-glucosamine 2-epimerase, UDP-hydrolysing [Lentisphaerae bacterium GWF2_44_16]|nr:MAG: UDP-N-acetyl-D-glucosamine 2-epimerase, UDP-hydrolysing [Lentisphaerae bacterium GWF2_44_16]